MLAEASRNAASMIAGHSRRLASRCSDKASSVRGAVLGILQAVAEAGEARAVATYAANFVVCLKDENMTVRRKAGSLCWAVADGGFASSLAAHVTMLVACFESADSLRVTPLRALAAMAEGGEARVVAHSGFRCMLTALGDKTAAARIAACDGLAALARGGCADELRRSAASTHGDQQWQILGTLTDMLLQDKEAQARVASAKALQAIAEADAQGAAVLRERHAESLQTAASRPFSSGGWELHEAISAVLGRPASVLPLDRWPTPRRPGEAWMDDGESESSDSECDNVGRGWPSSRVPRPPAPPRGWNSTARHASEVPCVICQRVLTRHGEVEVLPCGHSFHGRCIKQWFQNKAVRTQTCPMCRRRPISARAQAMSLQTRPAAPGD